MPEKQALVLSLLAQGASHIGDFPPATPEAETLSSGDFQSQHLYQSQNSQLGNQGRQIRFFM
jgi:hypothetical protein